VRALGAWVVVFRKPLRELERKAVGELLAAVRDVVEKWVDGGSVLAWEGVLVAAAVGNSVAGGEEAVVFDAEEWDGECAEYGFEFVDAEAKGVNEFGEKVGIERLREVLEANDWEGGADEGEGLLDGDDENGFNGSVEAEELEMNMELMGMKNAIHAAGDSTSNAANDGEEVQVEELEVMMHKLQAVRGLSTSSFSLYER
jgi:hypothetical protein